MTLLSPLALALMAALAACALMVAGVYLLAGLGWSLIAAAAPLFLLALILLRGLSHAE